VDELRSLRDSLFKVLTGKTAGRETDDDDATADVGDDDGVGGSGSGLLDAGAAKALIGALFARAGKSKDDVVQVLAREIGVAIAAMLKEPLSQLARHHKLTISFELVPKSAAHKAADEAESGTRAAPRREKPYTRPTTRTPKRSAARRKADK
jgi:hypothetical protein